jgi:DNA-directed RNA polymerase specialized sigma24 family protein
MAPESDDTRNGAWAQLAAEARRLAIGRRLAPGHTPEDVAQDAMVRLLSEGGGRGQGRQRQVRWRALWQMTLDAIAVKGGNPHEEPRLQKSVGRIIRP